MMSLFRFAGLAITLLSVSHGLTILEKSGEDNRVNTVSSSVDAVVTILLKMMNDFRTQASADASAWSSYQKWAQNTEGERTNYVRDQEGFVMSNTALVSAKQGDVQRIDGELTQLASGTGDAQRSLSTLETMRHKEHTQHEAQLTDLTQTLDAVGKAIQILEGHYSASPATLAEIKKRVQFALTLTGAAKQVNALTSLMQRTPDWLSVNGGESYNAYSSQSGGGVMGTLNELRNSLDANRQQSLETEATSFRDFQQQKAMQEGTMARLREETTKKTGEKGDAEAAIATGRSVIAQASQNQNDATMTLQQLSADLTAFTTEFQTRTTTRDDEMAATQAALDALQSISAGAKEGVSAAALVQFAKHPKLQKCTVCAGQSKKLLALSKKWHSDSLMQAAGELLQRSKGVFDAGSMDPVKQLLGNLIARLESEQAEESSHEDWCNTEKSSSITAKGQREQILKTLQGDIERFTVSVAQLKTEVEFLQSEVNRVNEENGVAQTNRAAAHSAFTTANAQHGEVITAINTALGSLAKMSLVQGKKTGKVVEKRLLDQSKKHTAKKESPFASYAGGSGGGGSASEMLQDLLGRYTTARTQLQSDEQNAVAAYNSLVVANTQFLQDTQATVNSRIAERRGKVMQLANDKAEVMTNFKELQQLAQYLQDLRPSCDDIRSTFEERKRRREAEISALKECLTVLSDPSSMR